MVGRAGERTEETEGPQPITKLQSEALVCSGRKGMNARKRKENRRGGKKESERGTVKAGDGKQERQTWIGIYSWGSKVFVGDLICLSKLNRGIGVSSLLGLHQEDL